MEREFLDEELIHAAKSRIASLYNTPIDKLSLEDDLCHDLKVSNQCFKLNQFDILFNDIYYASAGKLGEGLNTVKDYCDYVVYCYHHGDKRDILITLNLINDY